MVKKLPMHLSLEDIYCLYHVAWVAEGTMVGVMGQFLLISLELPLVSMQDKIGRFSRNSRLASDLIQWYNPKQSHLTA